MSLNLFDLLLLLLVVIMGGGQNTFAVIESGYGCFVLFSLPFSFSILDAYARLSFSIFFLLNFSRFRFPHAEFLCIVTMFVSTQRHT